MIINNNMSNKTRLNLIIDIKTDYKEFSKVIKRAKREWNKAVKRTTQIEFNKNHYVYLRGKYNSDLIIIRPFKNIDEEIGFNLHDTMIWHKKNPVPLTHNRYEQGFEYMFILSIGKPKTVNHLTFNRWRGIFNVQLIHSHALNDK